MTERMAMRAAVLEAVNRLVVKDVPTPRPGAGELLVKVAVCGIAMMMDKPAGFIKALVRP